MVRKYANNYSSTLNGAITNSATTITVTSATGLPAIGAGETYRLTIDDGTNIEVVEVTDDASSPTLTVTRGVDGTSGTAFANGDTVELRATAASFTDVLAADETPALIGPLDMSASGVYASFGGSSSTTAYNLTHSGGIPKLTGAANFYWGFTSSSLYCQAGTSFNSLEFKNDSTRLTIKTNNSQRVQINDSGLTVSNGALAVDNITVDANTISSTDANGNINLTPNGTGNVAVGNYTFDADQTVGAGQDNYVLTYDNATGLISLEASAGGTTSPGGSDTQIQYNNAGSFGGVSQMTYNGTNISLTTGLTVDGTADEIQLKVQGHSTQTSNIFEVETSAAANLFTVDNSGNVTVAGTVDGRDLATDGSKLDGIEALADVTDETNVVSALNGATLTDIGTPASTDLILLQDASDTNNLKVAQFSTFGGGGLSAASQAQMEAATDNTVAVTPGRTQYHPGVAKVWVNFNGTGTIATRGSHNVSSLTDNATGDYTVNYTTSFSTVNYAVVASTGDSSFGTGAATATVQIYTTSSPSTGSCRFYTKDTSSGTYDMSHVMFAAFGDQ